MAQGLQPLADLPGALVRMKPSDSVGRARAPHPVRVGVAAAAGGSGAAGAARAARAVRLAHSHRADGAVESVHAEVKEKKGVARNLCNGRHATLPGFAG